MASRLNLQSKLEQILGSRNVYFQPPESKKMAYPAIKYSRNDIDNSHADNMVYAQRTSYEIIVIDENPDSEIVESISKLPKCRWDRNYISDNLNHTVFTLLF